MSKKSEGLHANQLGDKWSVNSVPAAGTTVSASVSAPKSSKDCHIMEYLAISFKNTTAAAVTVTTSVRDASAAGTVLWSLDSIVTNAQTKEVISPFMGLAGGKGNALFITQNHAAASVVCSVSATGWTDNSQDY